jgi:AcrR family transcriptional regulator
MAQPAPEPTETRRARPGGRSERVLRQVVAATIEILAEEGVSAVTVDAVAQRAGVNPTTIYRRWGSPQLLMLSALREELSVGGVPPEDTGSLRGDLEKFMTRVRDYLQTNEGSALIQATFIKSNIDRDVLRDYFADRFTLIGQIFERARKRGEIPGDTDAARFIEVSVGAILFRLLLEHEPVTSEYLEWLIDFVLRGARATT